MQLITYKDNKEFLRKISKPVEFNDKELTQNIADLKEYTLTHDVWAMASVQIGIPKRIVYVKSTASTEPKDGKPVDLLLINPKITAKTGKTLFWEACASCGSFIGLVERPYEILVQYQNINGKPLEQKFTGFEATVLSHELDHLDGILHMDRALEIKNLEKNERLNLRKQEPYKIISKDCQFEYKEFLRTK